MESRVDYLRARILFEHLQLLSISSASSEISQEVSNRLSYATTVSLLEGFDQDKDISFGGISPNDIARYGGRLTKLSPEAIKALSERLEATLKDVTFYYHGTEELEAAQLDSLALSLDNDVRADITHNESESKALLSQLDTVMTLYSEAAEVHPRLCSSLEEIFRTLPSLLNANHTASHDLLAITIETLLLKLSVVRARTKASLYGHTSSKSRATVAQAVSNLHDKLGSQQEALDVQEREIEARLQDYHQLLELVDGQDGGFAQVVKDLAIVKRETDDCRNDLRRLGWTEN